MTAPEQIWLNDAGDYEAASEQPDGITWCDQKQDDEDTKYIRADLVQAMVAEAVAKERERCACIGYLVCAETRHVTLGDKVVAAISGAPADSGEDFGLAAIRAGKGE